MQHQGARRVQTPAPPRTELDALVAASIKDRAAAPAGAQIDNIYGAASAVTVASFDPIHRPPHYAKYPIEPITFIMANNIPFAEGAVIKYVVRWRDKGGVEDLKKARSFIDRLIENAEGAE